MEISRDTSPAPLPRTPPKLWLVWGTVFLSLLAFSAVRSPVPGVNEPHYLCKAKQYWNPDYCPRDFFLQSSNAHAVFYQTVGWFTQFLSLEQTAWLGRLLALGLLAWGWVRCVSRLVPNLWHCLWALWMYLALAAAGNLSGEWVVGGLEGKVFAYGFGFWAIAAWWDRHILKSALLAGLAVSFHPVVGGWIVVAAGGAILSTRVFPMSIPPETPQLSLKEWGTALGVFLLACLPGVLPAVQFLASSDPATNLLATQIQVFERIRHHLDPMTFTRMAYASYGLMLALWLLARTQIATTSQEPWFAAFVGISIFIALMGVGLGYGERPVTSPEDITWRYWFLKFYPFRLADILLPVAVSITGAGIIACCWHRDSGRRDRIRPWAIFACLMVFSLLAPAVDRNPSRMSEQQLADWLDVCRWIREETPTDTVVWTPASWAFKWYAERAEYVSRKDCPQDDAGIIEWKARMQHLLGEAMQNEPNLRFAIIRRGRMPIEPIYQNETYRIYDLAQLSR